MDLSHWNSVYNVTINMAIIATLLFFTISIMKDILDVMVLINENLNRINKAIDTLSSDVNEYFRRRGL